MSGIAKIAIIVTSIVAALAISWFGYKHYKGKKPAAPADEKKAEGATA